ncbi:MAG: hypothetical protein SPK13_08020 [Treponema sp.]|nr:hypothetical protein [Treponema sp.]
MGQITSFGTLGILQSFFFQLQMNFGFYAISFALTRIFNALFKILQFFLGIGIKTSALCGNL